MSGTPSSKYDNIEIGMWADTLLKLHPNTEWVRRPTVHRTGVKVKNVESLIVTYHYPGVDVTLELVEKNDPMFGKICVYAVQKIEEMKNGSDGEHLSDKGKNSHKKRRKAHRTAGNAG